MNSKHFKESEFACPCCGVVNVSQDLIDRLDFLRDKAQVPLTITSGYRCEKHNKEVGGTDESAHTEGLAADIRAAGTLKFVLLAVIFTRGLFKRIGIGKGFIHVDVAEDKPKFVVWTY